MAFINTTDLRKLQDITQRAYSFCSGFEGDEMQEGIADLLADIMKAQAILTNASDGLADPGMREAAHDTYGTDEIEIDDEPATAQADGGTWVAAWVWIEEPEVETEHCSRCGDEFPSDELSEDGECAACRDRSE